MFPCSNTLRALIHEMKIGSQKATIALYLGKTSPETHNIPVSFQVSQGSCLQDGADRLTDLTPLEIDRLLQFSKSIPGSIRPFPQNQYKSEDIRAGLIS